MLAAGEVRDQAQRLLEEVVFRLWVGAGIAVGAVLAARYLLEPDKSKGGR